LRREYKSVKSEYKLSLRWLHHICLMVLQFSPRLRGGPWLAGF